MKNESVYIIGAGNHAKIVLSTLKACGMCCCGIYDDDKNLWGKTLWSIPILGPVSDMPDSEETMEILSGDLNVELPGTKDVLTIHGEGVFVVPAHSAFTMVVESVTDYCCSYAQ